MINSVGPHENRTASIKRTSPTSFLPSLIHSGLGKLIFPLPAAPEIPESITVQTINKETVPYTVQRIRLSNPEIDAVLLQRNPPSPKWVLHSPAGQNGWEELFAPKIGDHHTHDILQFAAEHGNLLSLNYPGIRNSPGKIERDSMLLAYRTALDYLIQEVKATEILGYGYCFGALIQSEAIQKYPFPESVRFLSILDRAPISLYAAASYALDPYQKPASFIPIYLLIGCSLFLLRYRHLLPHLTLINLTLGCLLLSPPSLRQLAILIGHLIAGFGYLLGWRLQCATTFVHPTIVLNTTDAQEKLIHDGVLSASKTLAHHAPQECLLPLHNVLHCDHKKTPQILPLLNKRIQELIPLSPSHASP